MAYRAAVGKWGKILNPIRSRLDLALRTAALPFRSTTTRPSAINTPSQTYWTSTKNQSCSKVAILHLQFLGEAGKCLPISWAIRLSHKLQTKLTVIWARGFCCREQTYNIAPLVSIKMNLIKYRSPSLNTDTWWKLKIREEKLRQSKPHFNHQIENTYCNYAH